MDRPLAFAGTLLAIFTAIVGGTITIENRYAKSEEVRQQFDEFYARQLKLKILEIDLKPDPTPSDRALRQYLQQELNKAGR